MGGVADLVVVVRSVASSCWWLSIVRWMDLWLALNYGGRASAKGSVHCLRPNTNIVGIFGLSLVQSDNPLRLLGGSTSARGVNYWWLSVDGGG